MQSKHAASRAPTLGAETTIARPLRLAHTDVASLHDTLRDEWVPPVVGATVDGHDPAPTRPTPGSPNRLKTMLIVLDLVTTATALTIAALIHKAAAGHTLTGVWLVSAVSLVFWPIVFAQQGLYQARHLTRRIEELRRLANGTALGIVAVAGISVLLEAMISRGWLLIAAVSVYTLVALEREVVRTVIKHRRASGRMSRRIVLVGGNEEAAELASSLEDHPEVGYSVVGWVSDDTVPGSRAGDLGDLPHLGRADDTLQIVRDADAASVVVATTGISQEVANRVVRDLTREGYYVELSSSMRDIASRRATVRPLGRYPVVCVEPVTTQGWRPAFKRAFDIAVSLVALIVTLPVTLVAAIAIRITSGPGIFFRQTRVGRDGQLFTVYKLRTMVHDAEALLPGLMEQNEAAGPMFKMARDPRVTRVGRFLRVTSIDELPQLLNVLMGDMSLVGPRPALPQEAIRWNEDLRERLRVKPGITGNWQVNGRFTASMEDYQRLDLYYVDNWSIVTDLVILAKTIPAVLRRNGAA